MYYTQVGLKMKIDIQNREDLTLLVDQFYDRVLTDLEIGPFFERINFSLHKPKMVDFWAFVLLDETGYKTDVTQKHIHMPLKNEHFERWLMLFDETIEELFRGEKVNLAKQRARVIAWSVNAKLEKGKKD